MRVCVDASLVAAVLLPEERSAQAQALAEGWLRRGDTLIAPDLWRYEAVSIVFEAVGRGRVQPEEGLPTLAQFLRFPVTLLTPDHERVYMLALRLGLPAPYDAHYLAVAEAEGCEFWTGDRKLYERVHAALLWVHGLGE